MPVEKRKEPRRHLIFYLKLVQPENDELIGHLVDISPIGMMIICKDEMPVGKQMPVRLLLPSGFEEATQLELLGETVWCHKDVNPDYYAVGFRFSPLPMNSVFIIQDLVSTYGFQD